MHLARRGRLEDLVTLLREERHNVIWSQPPPAHQQVEDENLITPNRLIDYFDKMSTTLDAAPAIAKVKRIIFTEEILSKLRKNKTKDQSLLVVIFISDARFSALLKPNFSDIDLSYADLHEVDLTNAILIEADLSNADLSGAKLRGTDLRRADLTGAKLRRTVVYEADLGGADLRWADLRKTELGRATNLHGAKYNNRTQFSDNFSPRFSGMINVDE